MTEAKVNHNVSASIFALLDEEERESLRNLCNESGSDYTITE